MSRAWPAPAKLNLYLHVVGRRADGYHLLDSLVAFADVGDEIVATPAPDWSLRVTGPFAGTLDGAPADNLVARAAHRLAAQLGRPPAASVTLAKNLPVASGIGGGSADAAATLRALTDLWNVAPDAVDLPTLAAGLGADVPVCLLARAAWLGGIGEQVTPALDLPPTFVVLANPGIALATPAVFKARRGGFSAAARFDDAFADVAALGGALAARRNDLAEAAVSLVPEIGRVIDALAAQEGAILARMSGSGATCFALFAEAAAAHAASARLKSDRPRWWVAAGRLF
jgi:4-diphosphocytidyl-2-C-methyl-D-erythritol kinase